MNASDRAEAAYRKQAKGPSDKSDDKIEPQVFEAHTAADKTAPDRPSVKKIAKFLLTIGEQEAAKVIHHLPRDAADEILRTMKDIPAVHPLEAEALLKEFGFSAQKKSNISGGKKIAREMLEKAFGEEKAQHLLKKALPETRRKSFEFLKNLESHQLKLLLGGESLLVLSLVLPHIDKKSAAEYLATLPQEDRLVLIKRMARESRVSQEVVQRVESALQEKIKSLSNLEGIPVDGRAQLGEILKNLSPQDAESLLSELEDTDPELAQSLRNRLFTHERILRILDVDFEVFLRTIEDEDLALVIQALPEESVNKILSNVSERRRQWIRDEIDMRGPAARIEAAAALREFLSKVRKALADGDLRYKEDNPDEYV